MGIGRQFLRLLPALNIIHLFDILDKIYQILFLSRSLEKLSPHFDWILTLQVQHLATMVKEVKETKLRKDV